jgi:hypothetical protein
MACRSFAILIGDINGSIILRGGWFDDYYPRMGLPLCHHEIVPLVVVGGTTTTKALVQTSWGRLEVKPIKSPNQLMVPG